MTQVDFGALLRGWLAAAASTWGYGPVTDAHLAAIDARIPLGVRALIEAGYRDKLILPVGDYKFTLRGLPPGKGPYAWVGRDQAGQPAMHWEYLIQAAEYARVYAALAYRGYTVAAEDRLMDITVSDKSGSLLWYLEVKEKAIEVPGLVAKLRQYGVDGVDLNAPDRGNDPLRKAKYLVRYTPDYLSVSAIGVRQDFQVVARDSSHFTLVPDMVPFG